MHFPKPTGFQIVLSGMHINSKKLKEFLHQKFEQVENIEHIADGWWSQAFKFEHGKKAFVIRISKHLMDFQKDIFAYRNFNSPEIPVPEIMETGHFSEQLYYCISAFYPGTPSDQTDLDAYPALGSEILKPLEQIHRLDTSAFKGWGFTNEQGNGLFESWEAYLSAIHNYKYPVCWKELAKNTWLDAELFKKLIRQMEDLYPYLPKEKQVLHGDYGFDNILINKNYQVTMVLDWAEMLLGDALYDLIHMNEPWIKDSGQIDYLSAWLKEKESQKIEVRNLHERIRCYQIHYTLFHLHIHTSRKEEEDYHQIASWAKKHF